MDRTTNPIGWRAQVERFGVISLMLVVFTIPLPTALSLSMFPLLALLAWLFSGGFKDFPTLLRAAKWLPFREACLTQGLVVWFLTINLFNSFLFSGRHGTMFVPLAALTQDQLKCSGSEPEPYRRSWSQEAAKRIEGYNNP